MVRRQLPGDHVYPEEEGHLFRYDHLSSIVRVDHVLCLEEVVLGVLSKGASDNGRHNACAQLPCPLGRRLWTSLKSESLISTFACCSVDREATDTIFQLRYHSTLLCTLYTISKRYEKFYVRISNPHSYGQRTDQ